MVTRKKPHRSQCPVSFIEVSRFHRARVGRGGRKRWNPSVVSWARRGGRKAVEETKPTADVAAEAAPALAPSPPDEARWRSPLSESRRTIPSRSSATPWVWLSDSSSVSFFSMDWFLLMLAFGLWQILRSDPIETEQAVLRLPPFPRGNIWFIQWVIFAFLVSCNLDCSFYCPIIKRGVSNLQFNFAPFKL